MATAFSRSSNSILANLAMPGFQIVVARSGNAACSAREIRGCKAQSHVITNAFIRVLFNSFKDHGIGADPILAMGRLWSDPPLEVAIPHQTMIPDTSRCITECRQPAAI